MFATVKAAYSRTSASGDSKASVRTFMIPLLIIEEWFISFDARLQSVSRAWRWDSTSEISCAIARSPGSAPCTTICSCVVALFAMLHNAIHAYLRQSRSASFIIWIAVCSPPLREAAARVSTLAAMLARVMMLYFLHSKSSLFAKCASEATTSFRTRVTWFFDAHDTL